ncbi:MAG TPA: FtsW/RodA/SpoVE family cell cycle protein, partial [Candidatus Paceibacterota bacterium]|nr:FtsW/RodA/SpoVE family cell cycle protein [Candidatus Paceibacterota bacterium]
MSARYSKGGHHPDYFLLAVVFLLAVLGLVILASASSDLGKIKFDDSYYYLKHQLENGLVPGLVGFMLAYLIHYQGYRRISFLLLLGNLALLAMVFTPFGLVAGGASRWLRFGPISFQPAEFLKITYILYLAAWLANTKMDRARDLMTGLLPFLIVSGTMAGLLIMQPATSIVVILLAAGCTVYFVSGANILRLAFVSLIAIAAFSLVIFASPYRRDRILTFLHPERDSQKSSYQINQAITAIGSGGLTGMGYGQSASKVKYLPAPLDDSI